VLGLTVWVRTAAPFRGGVDFKPIPPQEGIEGKAATHDSGDNPFLHRFKLIPTATAPRAIAPVAILLATMASGCALIGGGTPALDTYELSAPSAPKARGKSSSQILIAEPGALKALDGENIVIKTGPGSIQYLKGAQWADRLPLVVQARLAESFQNSGAFGGVGTPGEGLAIDYQVVAELRSFEIRVDGGSRADVEIFVRILNDRNGVVRAAKVFKATAPVSGSGNEAYRDALNAAFDQAGAEIVAWVDSLV
jgi:cholesterol transport system auxiliary component